MVSAVDILSCVTWELFRCHVLRFSSVGEYTFVFSAQELRDAKAGANFYWPFMVEQVKKKFGEEAVLLCYVWYPAVGASYMTKDREEYRYAVAEVEPIVPPAQEGGGDGCC